jgi:anti-sigma factor RsiW
MTCSEGTSQVHGCGDDVAAYALGALGPGDVDAFRQHLAHCAVCPDELAAFEQVVRELPLAGEQFQTPESLRERVLRAIADEPKREPANERRRRRPRGSWFFIPRPALAPAAVALVAVIVVGALQFASGSTQSRVYNAIVTGSSGTAQVRVSNGRADLIVHRFAPPPAGEIYQVWLRRPNRSPEPTTALFSVTANGDGDVEVPGNLHGVKQVMVTPEPVGGTKVPTHSAVIRAQLT